MNIITKQYETSYVMEANGVEVVCCFISENSKMDFVSLASAIVKRYKRVGRMGSIEEMRRDPDIKRAKNSFLIKDICLSFSGKRICVYL